MRQQDHRTELHEKTHQLLQGPLKHVRGAALAAALLPLASVAATPASAQSAQCASGGICGYVWNDTNQNGIQDSGEGPIVGAVVSIDGVPTPTDDQGFYYFFASPGETHVISVQIPPGMEPSPPNVGSDDTIDSDGVSDGLGNSVATMTLENGADANTDFGFFTTPIAQPGTGTPGYWKTHPDVWQIGRAHV